MAAIVQRPRQSPDHWLLNLTLLLMVVGVVAVYDSSYAYSMDRLKTGFDGFYFLKRQAVYAVIGLAAMFAVSRIGYWRLRQLAAPMLLACVVLLLLVWAPVIGHNLNGASRWVGKGMFQFQPSELAKMALVIYLGALLSRPGYNIRSFAQGLMVPLLVMGLVVVLVEREPDMGTAGIIFLASLVMLYLAGAGFRHLAMIVAVASVFFTIAMFFGHRHIFRKDRLTGFVDNKQDIRGRDFQPLHGLYAVGSGGIRGVGIGAGREKFYLPEANTDYIFATIAEETGLVGSVLLVGLLFLLGRQGFVIARRTRDSFGAMLAAGLAAMISLQAVLNLAVVTRLVPPTGIPLPFVSYGGTSLIFLLIAVGILLNISRHPDAPVRGAGSVE